MAEISFTRRLFIFLAVWFLPIVASQMILKPDGPTESDLSELQQRVQWVLFVPLIVLLGLSFGNPAVGLLACWGLLCFTIHILGQRDRRRFRLFIIIYSVILTASVPVYAWIVLEIFNRTS